MTRTTAALAETDVPASPDEIVKLRSDLQNSFHLVVLASQRAKQLAAGARPRIDPGEHKPVRVAVLEVHAGLVSWSVGELPVPGAAAARE